MTAATLDTTHAAWFADVRRILATVEVTPGLPLPFISGDRVSFCFTGIVHAADAREAVETAESILGYALDVAFAVRRPDTADPARWTLEAFLPGGMAVTITALTRHIRSDPREQRDTIRAGSLEVLAEVRGAA
jgi:hypothetical protein